MKKNKTRIQVKGNPLYYKAATPNRPINHPATGTPKFCEFPAIEVRGKNFSGGPVYLREGRHLGPNQGFGVQHIWREHFKSLIDPNEAEREIAQFVAAVLTTGASIYYEGGTGKLQDRACVLRNQHGTVILEEKLDGHNNVYYSVVTAIPAASAHGTLVGSLE